MSDGYTLNKSTYDSLEIVCSFDLELALLLINCSTLILRHATHKYVIRFVQIKWNERFNINVDEEQELILN